MRELGIKYMIWGEEVTPTTGRAHLQGYVVFAEGVTRRTVKRRLDDDTINVRPARGDAASNIAYCRKRSDAVDPPYAADPDKVVVTYGDAPAPGTRTDLAGIRTRLRGGASIREMFPIVTGLQGIRYAEKWMSYLEPPRTEPPCVYWYWGPTGTGKTRCALADATERVGDDIWWANGGLRWFCGYDRHRAVILDDFRPAWCKLHVLLRLLDRYEVRVEPKHASRQWVPEHIYITCPDHPNNIFLDTSEEMTQLLRRITQIREFVRDPSV